MSVLNDMKHFLLLVTVPAGVLKELKKKKGIVEN